MSRGMLQVLLALASALAVANCDCQLTAEATSCGNDVCYHGRCETAEVEILGVGLRINESKCICDDLWFDARCHECCDIECPPMYKCQAELNVVAWSYDKVCRPDPDNNTTQSDNSNSTQSTGEVDDDITLDYNSSNTRNKTCTSVERNTTSICGGFFTCHNGECEESNKTETFMGWLMTSGSCHCDEGWVGHRCDTCCDLPCKHGNCAIEYPNEQMTCYCHPDFMGQLCEDLRPTTTPRTLNVTVIQTEERAPGWYWIVIGCSIAIVIVSAIVFFIMMYILWTRRNIYILQIVRIFQTPEDENDGKEYDAFVSASSCEKDTDFCLHQLKPKVESEMGYRLFIPCIHEISGIERGNYKAALVEASRRTILLLSPEYLKEEWSRFEYVVAQNEMLKLRHKIIPIILNDINCETDMDPAMKNIIKSLGSIVWPGEEDERKLKKFWKKVEFSLPKKRRKNEQGVEREPKKQTICKMEVEKDSAKKSPNPMTVIKDLFTNKHSKSTAQKSTEYEMAV